MDILKLITDKDRLDYSENYNYQTTFKLSPLFPPKKSKNLKADMAKLVENGNLPVMAQFHAFDTEARIGDRTNYREIEVEKLFIKEKLNQSERIALLLGNKPDKSEALDFIFDDMGNLTSRVLVRAELANNQVMATGKLEVNENNFKTVVDYGYQTSHNVSLSGWDDPDHDILGDIETVQKKAKAIGKVITRALTSEKIVGYMVKNNGIRAFFKDTNSPITEARVLSWIAENYRIRFATNDNVYKTSANDATTHRFFPENKISFFTGEGAFGQGLYGVTPEELKLTQGKTSRGYVTITQWETPDPVATWTKASAIYLPVIKDIDGLFIATVSKASA